MLILYISGGSHCLKSTPNDRFFEKLFTAILFTLRVFATNLLGGNRRRNAFRISFWCLAWDSNPCFSSNKPTHYLLDHDNISFSITSGICNVCDSYRVLTAIKNCWRLTAIHKQERQTFLAAKIHPARTICMEHTAIMRWEWFVFRKSF